MNLEERIRDVPNFPKEGIVFKDITPLLQDAAAFRYVIDLLTKSYHDKAGCLYNQAQALPDQRFYGITVTQDRYLPLIFTYLNSSLAWAQMEAQGNTNMGFGVLDTNVYWLKSLRIPVEALTEKNQVMTLMEQLTKEKDRFSMLQFSQIREDIDSFYAKYFDLSNNSMKRLYDFILRSINNRIR